jgi:ATP-dependent DNA helicase RecG
MNVRTIDENDALQLCLRQEDHFFDRKSYKTKPARIQRIAVAFANADGGEFVVGIADSAQEPDPARRWQGTPSIEDWNQHIQALTEITPSLPFRFSFLVCQEMPGYVLHVQIDKSTQVHKTPSDQVFVRLSAQCLPVKDPARIVEISYAKGAISAEDEVVRGLHPESIVDSPPIAVFLADYSPKTDPLDFAVNQNLLDVVTWEPKVSGLLLFAENPSSVVPRQVAVKIARYETREDEPFREHLSFTETLEGPMYELLHTVAPRITEIMSAVSIWTPEGLKRIEYPPEAIWEVLVNALIHRDYSISDHVQIHIYNNRIEFLSPGRLPGYVTAANILDARYSRNPRIVRTLNRYKDPPNRDMGEGLNTAFQKMKEWRLQPPTIEEEANYVKVTIPHAPLATPEEAILQFLETHDSIKNAQARDITGIGSENAVKNVFYKLRDQGYIERVPGLAGSASAWRRAQD